MIEDIFTPHADDESFRHEVRAFLVERLPAGLRDKVRDGRPLVKDELLGWHRILAERGWLAPNWPKAFGGTGWSPMRRWIYEEEYHTNYCPPVHLFNFKMLMKMAGLIQVRYKIT